MPTGVYIRTEKTIAKMRESHKRKNLSKETLERMSIAQTGKRALREVRTCESQECNNKFKVRITFIKKYCSRDCAHKNRTHKPHSEETKRKIGKSRLKNWQNPEYKEKQLKAIFAGCDVVPNKPERKLRRGLNKLFPGEYKFVGNKTFWIGGKNPDFINVNGQKKVIEMFGDYWHSKKVTGVSTKKHESYRVIHFAKYGYETLIVWQYELQNIKQLKKKLINFQNI